MLGPTGYPWNMILTQNAEPSIVLLQEERVGGQRVDIRCMHLGTARALCQRATGTHVARPGGAEPVTVFYVRKSNYVLVHLTLLYIADHLDTVLAVLRKHYRGSPVGSACI